MKKILSALGAIFCLAQAKAQCPTYTPKKQMASSFHSSVIINNSGVVRYWGQANSAVTAGANVLSPLTLTGYSGTPVAVAAGSSSASAHQLFLLTTDSLYGWGSSFNTINSGISGNVTLTPIPLPTGIRSSQVEFIEAACGGLAIVTKSGQVWVKMGGTITSSATAGTLPYGQFGDSTNAASTTWHQVKTGTGAADSLTGVVALSYGGRALMALTGSGNVYVWGDRVFLGDGSGAASFGYARLVTLPSGVTPADVNIISRQSYNANNVTAAQFILGTNGKMYGLGENYHGTLGIGNETDQTTWQPVRTTGGTADLDNIVQIGSDNPYVNTSYSAGALTSAGKLFLWGDNTRRMLASDTLFAADSVFYLYPHIPNNFNINGATIGYFEMGGHTTAAFLAGSSKFCYVGHKVNGSMGDGVDGDEERWSFDCINTPEEYICPPSTAIGCPLPSAKDIVASSNHATIVINGQPTVAFWGQAASSAEPGVNMPAAKTLFEYNGTPTGVAAGGVSETVSAQGTQFWLQTTAGLYGWGYSANTIFASRVNPTPLADVPLPSGVTISQVSFIRASRGGVALVTTSGAVYVKAGAASACSGRVYGDGSTTLDAAGSTVWHQVTTGPGTFLTGVTELSFGGTAALAITSSGTAYVWGNSVLTGSGAAADRTRATAMTLHSDFTGSVVPRSAEIIQSGTLEAVEVICGSNNRLYTIGRNANGALGTGSSTFTTVSTTWNLLPVPVGVRKIGSNNPYANDIYALGAITLNGNVYLWGSNSNGMIGAGAATEQTTPTIASTVAANDATNFEIAGHHTIIFVKSTTNFYFAGHVQGGSKADATADGNVTTFTLGGSVANCANVTFNITGNVYNDTNGVVDNLVNGIAISSLRGTALNVNLLDESGYVIATTPVTGGTYSFTGYPFGNYVVQLSPTAGTVFSLAPTTTIPANWVFTGEQIGTTAGAGIDGAADGKILVSLSETKSNVNFGVEQLPTATAATLSNKVNPGGTKSVPISAGFTGVDTTGSVTKIHITAFPTNATSITIGSTTYTSGTWPGAGVTYTRAGTVVSLDPIDGAVTSVIPFKAVDAADLESTLSANLSISFVIVPPVANNITAPGLNSHDTAMAIPQMQASSPAGVAINTFNVLTVPPSSEGVLLYCASAPATCALGSLTAITSATSLTPAQAASLYFNPAQTFIGNSAFTYSATDANGLVSNTANYLIPVGNKPPTAQSIRTAQIIDTDHAAALPDLLAADADGTVVSYTVSSIPASTSGVLTYCSNGTDTCTGTMVTISGTTTLTPAQMRTMKFDPTLGFSGNYSFNYTATDDNGLVSNTATYTVPVVFLGGFGGNQPPVVTNVTSQNINNSLGKTAIPNLLGSDPDGLVDHFTIGGSVPNPATQGTLYYCAAGSCTLGTLSTLAAGATLSLTQAATLFFDPLPSFVGTASFTYTATDNAGTPLTSGPATYNIPVVNNPPVANPTTVAPIWNGLTTPTLLPTLSGNDADGTVDKYNIVSVPAASSGTLKYCATAPTTPCTPATLTTISSALTGLNADQVATLNFIPNSTFTGTYVFTFATVDNNNQVSQAAAVTIPVVSSATVTGQPPVAYSYNASAVNSASTAPLPSALSGTDPDGSVVYYTITAIPAASHGALTYCVTPPSTGCGTAVAVGTNLSPAQAATLLFTPNSSFTGIATFAYVNTDNDSNLSNTATVTIPVNNNPPVANNVNNPSMTRTATATTLNSLAAADGDGTIVRYIVQTIPTPDQGVLYVCTTPPSTGCVPVTAGQILTPAQASLLAFQPDTSVHSPIVSFMYTAVDNSSNISNLASVNIPIANAFELPVELIAFTAVKKGDNAALIAWQTGVETADMLFVLEHSTDAKTWTSVNEQKAHLAPVTNFYSYYHSNLSNGKHYYRLKIVESDGASYSPVRVLTFDNGQTEYVQFQPNPVTDKLYLNTSNGMPLQEVNLYNSAGKKLRTVTQLNSGTAVDMSDCASGLYLLKVTDSEGRSQVIKVTKK